MNAREHFARAEAILEYVAEGAANAQERSWTYADSETNLALAQVHATLAVAAAAIDSNSVRLL